MKTWTKGERLRFPESNKVWEIESLQDTGAVIFIYYAPGFISPHKHLRSYEDLETASSLRDTIWNH